MFMGFPQHKCFTLQKAQKMKEVIKNKTNIQPEIFKIQDSGHNFFIVAEQPCKFIQEDELIANIN